MGIPWHLALKAIPWDTILANAPGILRSADALLSETKVRPPAAAARNDIQALADRVAVLEQRDRETAELLTRVVTQVAALTTAIEVLQARVRWLLVVAIAASVMSVLACGVALFAR
jgi:response regulator RpfG family c-di-GMP phosphodiesterase